MPKPASVSRPPGPAKRTASVAQLKARLSEYLRQVKSGEEVVITERGLPIARLAPLETSERRATREQRLIRAGILRPPKESGAPLGVPTGDPAIGAAVLAALLKDREEGY